MSQEPSEMEIVRDIMIELSRKGHKVFRANVGLYFTKDGRPVRTGLPNGFSDIFGFRAGDCRAFFIEVKTQKGRVSDDQKAFLTAMKNAGAVAGVCRSSGEALALIET